MENSRLKDIVKLVTSIIICEGAGLLGAVFTTPAIPTWYAALNKPAFTPPSWLFAPVWTGLYLLMAIAAFLVWRKGLDDEQVRGSMVTFMVQLALNVLWSAVFFGLKSPLWGVIVIAVLWVAILLTMLAFMKVSKTAAWLMLPYLLWVSFASALTVSVWMLN
ncbi:MAG: tryptophan-rich sensory protein [Dehalococcoidales bacterium]|nr:tryptophan-rich sensory protein [Dehalococcoidales bacterium]